MPEIKFCGLTRAEDARSAVACHAAYLGVVFADGPRRLDPARAREVLDGAGRAAAWRVGVFGSQPAAEILHIADEVELDVVQLHDGVSAAALISLRHGFGGAIWVVAGVSGAAVRGLPGEVIGMADAVVLDTALAGRAGGTGVVFDWAGTAPAVSALRKRCRVVLAGGLRADNVAEAVRTLSPDVVDVSSGVERAPGIKDLELMRAFALAARSREER